MDLSVRPPFSTILTNEQLEVFKVLHETETYNSVIVDKIIENHKVELNEEEKDNLGTFVYIARHQLREIEQENKTNKLITHGWSKLTNEIAKELNGKKIKVLTSRDNDWLTIKIDDIYKVQVSGNDGSIWLMKPRARTRGYRLQGFNNPMYQLI